LTLIVQPSEAQSSLPSGWANQDVGSVGTAGQTLSGGGVFTLQGGGTGICCESDQFQYAYTALIGDGTIVARLLSTQNATTSSQVGIMIRNSLDPQSRHVFLRFAGTGSGIVDRPGDGLSTDFAGWSPHSLPEWLKLVREGSNITASVSPDGITWTTVDTTSISMNGTVYAGLAVTSQDDPNLTTATFDHVSVAQN
jgi:hypothetical protein